MRVITDEQVRTQDSKAKAEIGSLAMTEDGRFFRYMKAGADISNVARAVWNGSVCPGATNFGDTDGFEGVLATAAVAGDLYVDIADTGSAVKDYYKGGYFVFFASGYYSTIFVTRSEQSNGTYVRCWLAEPVPTAISATIGITVYLNPWANCNGTNAAQSYKTFVGLNHCVVTSGYYFWGQVSGPCWITAHGGTWPGSAANYRDVFFWIDGTVDPSSVADPTSGYQRAGYLISGTESGYGDAFVYLQLM